MEFWILKELVFAVFAHNLIFLSDPWSMVQVSGVVTPFRKEAYEVCGRLAGSVETMTTHQKWEKEFQIFGMLLRLLFFFGSIDAIYPRRATHYGCDFELWNPLTVVHCRRMRPANFWSCCMGRCWAIIRSERCTISTAWRASSAWSKLHRWKHICRPLADPLAVAQVDELPISHGEKRNNCVQVFHLFPSHSFEGTGFLADFWGRKTPRMA